MAEISPTTVCAVVNQAEKRGIPVKVGEGDLRGVAPVIESRDDVVLVKCTCFLLFYCCRKRYGIGIGEVDICIFVPLTYSNLEEVVVEVD